MACPWQQAAPLQVTTTRQGQATIETLPTELIRCIANHLELKDVCSLRQTCRSLAQSGSVGLFENAIKRRRLRLSEEGLRHFINGLGISPRMQQVQDLTIWANHDATEVKLVDEDGDWSMPDVAALHTAEWQWKHHVKVVTMLHEVIEHLAKLNDRCFQRIELIVKPHLHWEDMIVGNQIMPRATGEVCRLTPWDAPTEGQQQQLTVELMFAMVRDALQHAETSCVHLELFTGVRGCNLDYGSWMAWLHSADSNIVLQEVKTVGLRVRTPDDSQGARPDSVPNIADLPRLQQVARRLQSYHVHWFTLPHNIPDNANDHILHRLSLCSASQPSQLTSCTLQGIVAQDRDLLALFHGNLGLQKLRLERPRILLAQFSVKDIFDAVQTELKSLQYLAISGMRANGLVYFDSPAPLLPWQTDRVYWPSGTAAVETSENLERRGKSVHAPILWSVHQEVTLGCLKMMTTREAMAREFGR